MEIHFKKAHTKDVEDEATPDFTSKVERKLGALKKYLGKDESIAEAYVELGKVTEAHHTGDIWQSQINLDMAGSKYHAKGRADTLLKAADAAINEIESELRTVKKRKQSMIRKGGIAVKAFMRGFGSK